MTIQSKTRASRMKITGTTVSTVNVGGQSVAAPVQQEAPQASAPALQSEVLKPAAEALGSLPDFDAARVAELRDQLARGELPFDPARLAGLIQKFHGGR
ncbi:flagellar biosynthesis anti-sigma factor FlgM [Massilia sp. KIM]|uniref:flagellar biosynthesis anti-sigma factor FlgM n=1 Tax=Massilia sp. KIM TaxID=1955422 RepID=UPI0027D7FD2E|nr:flagellar biosynthesis anti-sigma factor FlgM [Massilia sp. KIM]